MSGVEIAGIALAVLPLIINALEDYEEGLDPIKSFMRWEKELPKCIRKLRNQHVHFEQNMRLLLEPITTDYELAEMLSDPNGQYWKDGEMSEKLRERLQESYHAYQGTIGDIERIMKKIASKLDLDRAAELSRNDLEAILAANPLKNNKFEFRKRVRFGMSKKNIKGLLEELDDCNKELERFADRNEKLETYRKAAKPSFAGRLQQVQKYAQNLHSVLVSSWSCSCRNYHSTSLQLEQRGTLYASAVKKVAKSTSEGTCFTVSFSSSGDFSHPWTWQEAEIHIDNQDAMSVPAQPSLKPKTKMTKTVSFGDKAPPPYSVVDPVAKWKPSPTLQEVKDLCASIQQMHKSATCIGFQFDSKSLRGAYEVETPAARKIPTVSQQLITLETLLKDPPKVNGRALKLSKKERYGLAVTLASSTLQLNATPWFPDNFKAKDILFCKNGGARLVDINHPYVAAKKDDDTKGSPAANSRGFHNKNTILLALAIALLELYFGESAEAHAHDATAFSTTPWGLAALAHEWAETEKEDLSAAFLGAVRHCLRCFSDPGASLQDSEFLQAAVEGIVLPLQEELHQFLGKATP
ncbi:hypothetical protein EJ04DRAFT_585903 [Polyplosphaeria fusca]|uniref:DUF7580 domain-containing protein n=1 Tax=Polyplosphaeria fusca TaxID=682080 RepID=A0A9P4V6N8_9PLEO|nr:hypothetical protein EJ04DRAFT_585903 [Polyplosphaeria fusca]